ncbi:hypothetical protein AVEN_139486-1 [Araneus ventricosus]|uniref:Calponin-homology (CH) domain-containing protein n=1 Tax=Araneus ventricosus TaxID=182803 RepID=A0A4Y2UV19_ARAVE|nr:hypothetical protein AVEN_139486-1 [Araneus ventricosus]
MNYIKPNSIPGEIKNGNLKQKRENIVKFLKAMENYGVPKEYLFQPDDLLLLRNIPNVTRCLFKLGRLRALRKHGLGYSSSFFRRTVSQDLELEALTLLYDLCFRDTRDRCN